MISTSHFRSLSLLITNLTSTFVAWMWKKLRSYFTLQKYLITFQRH